MSDAETDRWQANAGPPALPRGKKRWLVVGVCILGGLAWLVFGLRPFVCVVKSFEELAAAEKREIETTCDEVMARLRAGEFAEVWEDSHPLFKKAMAAGDFTRLGELLKGRLGAASESRVAQAWVISIAGERANFEIVCGSADPDAPEHFRARRPVGVSKFVVVLVRIDSRPIGRTATFVLARHEGLLRLLRVDMSDSSLDGKDSSYYASLGERWTSDGKMLSAHVAYAMALFFETLGPAVTSGRALKFRQHVSPEKVQRTLKNRWTVEGVDYQVFRVGIISTLTDIWPHVQYVSRAGLEPEGTEVEATALLEYVAGNFPELAQEFRGVIFEACERVPAPGERLPTYRVPLRFPAAEERR